MAERVGFGPARSRNLDLGGSHSGLAPERRVLRLHGRPISLCLTWCGRRGNQCRGSAPDGRSSCVLPRPARHDGRVQPTTALERTAAEDAFDLLCLVHDGLNAVHGKTLHRVVHQALRSRNLFNQIGDGHIRSPRPFYHLGALRRPWATLRQRGPRQVADWSLKCPSRDT